MNEWKRTCPSCDKVVSYLKYGNWWRANKFNRICVMCAKIKRISTQFKNGHLPLTTTQSRLKASIASSIRYKDKNERIKTSIAIKKAMHHPDVRKKHIDGLFASKWIKVKTDKGQLELLEKWNRLGFHFEPNYQIKTAADLFYIDGYDPLKNVVMEYDGKYHNTSHQKQKDLVRQQVIIENLNPKKFWRYDSVSKQCRNILGE